MAAQAAQATQAAQTGAGSAGGVAASAEILLMQTDGVIVVNCCRDNAGVLWFLVAREDRNDKRKCPPDVWDAWRALFKNGKAPHTVYYWTYTDLTARYRVVPGTFITRYQALKCAAAHMIQKGWIPTWAPDTITKASTFEEVAALPCDFYVRLADELKMFTALVPWANTFPAEKLEPGEKTEIATGDTSEGARLLGKVADRANYEEGCIYANADAVSHPGEFLSKPKRKASDKDSYTFVVRRDFNVASSVLLKSALRLGLQRRRVTDYKCAHSYFNGFGNFVEGFDAERFKKEVKAYHETDEHRLMTAEQIRMAGDQKTLDALALVADRPWKKKRVE